MVNMVVLFYSRMASNVADVELHLHQQLKEDVLHVLSNHPDGVEKSNLWNTVTVELGRKVSAKRYKLQKMNDILNEWKDEIEEFGNAKRPLLRIRQKSSHNAKGSNRNEPPNLNDEEFPSLGELKLPLYIDKPNCDKIAKGNHFDEQDNSNRKSPSAACGSLAQNITNTQSAEAVVSEIVAEGKSKESNSESSDIVATKMKKTIVEVFSKIGPAKSIILGVLWKLVSDQLGQVSINEFKAKLKTFNDVLEVDIPAGPNVDETYKLRNHIISGLNQNAPETRLFNQQSQSDAEKAVVEGDKFQASFKNMFGQFLRSLLKHYPDGCSVNVILQNIELRKHFPVITGMCSEEVHHLLGNIQGVWFDGTLCFLSVSAEIAKRVQLLTIHMMLSGNVRAANIPVLANSLRIADYSLNSVSDRQIFHILETTCVPKFLYRNGQVFCLQEGITLQNCNIDLETGFLNPHSPTAGIKLIEQAHSSEKNDLSVDDDQSSDDDKQVDTKINSPQVYEADIADIRISLMKLLNRFPDGLKLSKLSQALKVKKTYLKRHFGDILEKIGTSYRLKDRKESSKLLAGGNKNGNTESEKTTIMSTVSGLSNEEGKLVDSDSDIAQLDSKTVARVRHTLSTIHKKYPDGLKYDKIRLEISENCNLHLRESQLLYYCNDLLEKVGKVYQLKKPTGLSQQETKDRSLKARKEFMDITTWSQPAREGRACQSPETVDLTTLIGHQKINKSESLSYHGIRTLATTFQPPRLQFASSPMQQGQSLGQPIPTIIPGQPGPTTALGHMQGSIPQKREPNSPITETNSPITAMDCSPVKSTNFPSMTNNPFMERDTGDLGSRFKNVVADLPVQPIVKKDFEVKEIVIQPVYLPRGQRPTSEMVESIAKECIDVLADANEFVSPERVEKLLCQKFGVQTIRQLGHSYDKIGCIYEMTRMICKVNAYIVAFVKTRSICTLYELQECLRDFVPNKEDFSKLKLGPLQRFPVVWEQLRFPPDQEEIPKIRSTDILEHFRNYLCKENKWTSHLELEDFMNYLVGEYSAENAYYLGVRIRSLPLAAQVCS